MIISDKVKKIAVVIARVFLGIVFVFSGYAKAVDPLGSNYKIQDYLTAMGLEGLASVALVAGILLAAFEFLLGVCLLLGANLKQTSILTILLMAFMTPLTLWIAIANPVSDCGCFGDALILTNWQTFWKNVLFSALAVLIFLWHKFSPKLFTQRTEWIIAICAGGFSILISLYCYINLPIIDFRPYKNGTNLIEAMKMPGSDEDIQYVSEQLTKLSDGTLTKEACVEAICQPQFHLKESVVLDMIDNYLTEEEKDTEDYAQRIFDSLSDKYETMLIYEKDGVAQEFTLQNYPKDDPAWKYVDSKNELKEKGYEPPIHDFTMEHPDDGDITEEVLANPGYTFLLVSYRVEKASTNKRKVIKAIYDYCLQNDYKFYCLTATGLNTKEMQEYKVEMGGVEYPFVNTDEITLKTIVRSNPGLVLIKNGVVINKWSDKNMPTFTEPLENSPRGQIQQPNDRRVVFLSTLLFLGVLVGVFAIDKVIALMVDKLKKGKNNN
ncbi:MAG: DoxX family protein [Paludibacteraceae bacterium]|nr:DoxX family protein [Paludibacteraceae bacterium]